MTREEAKEILTHNWTRVDNPNYSESELDKAFFMAIEALSAGATKKKAELKENGDWDCPDVDCEECDHYRSVDWCSLAIPNHEEIDDTYMMVTEAFFEGFEAAEKRYRLLIETIEEFDEKSANAVEVVRCKNCIHKENWDAHIDRWWCKVHRGYFADDYFCADGREDGEA